MKLRFRLFALAFLPFITTFAAAQDCSWHGGVWTSYGSKPGIRDELRFVDGVTSGVAIIERYQDDDIKWRATGKYQCSSGVPVCYLMFPLATTGHTVTAEAFEIFEQEGKRYLAAPTFYASSFNLSRGEPPSGSPAYRGLRVAWQAGHRPADGDFVLPHNIYSSPVCVDYDERVPEPSNEAEADDFIMPENPDARFVFEHDGELVETVQELLFNRGYDIAVDGVYGGQTETAIKRLQANIKDAVTGQLTNKQFALLEMDTAPNVWAAISMSTDGKYGFSYQKSTRSLAMMIAERRCKRISSRPTDCAEPVTAHSEQWVAAASCTVGQRTAYVAFQTNDLATTYREAVDKLPADFRQNCRIIEAVSAATGRQDPELASKVSSPVALSDTGGEMIQETPIEYKIPKGSNYKGWQLDERGTVSFLRATFLPLGRKLETHALWIGESRNGFRLVTFYDIDYGPMGGYVWNEETNWISEEIPTLQTNPHAHYIYDQYALVKFNGEVQNKLAIVNLRSGEVEVRDIVADEVARNSCLSQVQYDQPIIYRGDGTVGVFSRIIENRWADNDASVDCSNFEFAEYTRQIPVALE